MLGVSYLLAIPLEWGLSGIYVGIVASYGCWAVIVVAGFVRGDWAKRAAGMMKERESIPD
jgi:Na+-driven multidrug efflux pump